MIESLAQRRHVHGRRTHIGEHCRGRFDAFAPGALSGCWSLSRLREKMVICRYATTTIRGAGNRTSTVTTWQNSKSRLSWIIQWKTVLEREERESHLAKRMRVVTCESYMFLIPFRTRFLSSLRMSLGPRRRGRFAGDARGRDEQQAFSCRLG